MKTKNYITVIIILVLSFKASEGFCQWVSEPVVDNSNKNCLMKDPLGFDAENNFYVGFINKIPTGSMGMTKDELWLTWNNSGDTWAEPFRISEEEVDAISPAMAIGQQGEIYFSYKYETSTGTKYEIIKKEGQELTSLEMPFGENIKGISMICDKEGDLHVAVASTFYEEVDKNISITDIAYGIYSEGEWNVEHIPGSQDTTDESASIDVSPDGAVHILYAGSEEDNFYYHYLTNQSGEWEKSTIIQITGTMQVLGFAWHETSVNMGIYKQDLFLGRETYYIRMSQGQEPEIIVLDYESENGIKSFSFDIDSEGKPVFLFSEIDEPPAPEYNSLFISVYRNGVFEHTKIMDQAWIELDAFVAFDNEDKIQVIANTGNLRDIYLLYEQEYFSASFNVINQNQEPITDAVITFNEQTNPAGEYTFSELIPGTYTYSVSRDGYYPAEGEVTISNEDLELNIEIETDYTGSTLSSEQNLLIFPNPATERIYINSEILIESILIFDNTGRKVFTAKPGSCNYEIDVDKLTAGIYFIKVKSEETYSKKLVIY